MLGKFKSLPTIKKTIIVLILIIAFFVLAPLTIKYASAGEIDLFAMVQQLFTRVDDQEARISELETKVGNLEAGEPETDEPADPGEPGGELGDNGDGGDGSAPPDNGDLPSDGSGDPPSNSGGDPTSDPDPIPEPEPWPQLSKIDYKLGPIYSEKGRFEYRFEGTVLHCDFFAPVPEKMKYSHLIWERRYEETKYAFTESIDLVVAWENWEVNGVKPKLEGRLPRNVIINPERIGNIMKFDLANWYGDGAPYEVTHTQRQIYVLP